MSSGMAAKIMVSRTLPISGPTGATAEATQPAASDGSQPSLTWAKLQRVLTDRELEVLKMVARGMSNAEIAEELTISPATAKTHVAHLLTKLDARDRIQLVIIAYQSGLVGC